MIAAIVAALSLGLAANPHADEELNASSLGVLYRNHDSTSERVARYYARRRGVPIGQVIGVDLPDGREIRPTDFDAVRAAAFARLADTVQALLLVWPRPYAVGCMSITTAFAIGYHAPFCVPGCDRTEPSPLYDNATRRPWSAYHWRIAMLLPTDNEALALQIIDRGIVADLSRTAGVAYLVKTDDPPRNVRSLSYPAAIEEVHGRIAVRVLEHPPSTPLSDILAYFTGVPRVVELPLLHFVPGAAADHLTSAGGALEDGSQMPATAWLQQGATASYGAVIEPCNHLGKFPNPAVFLDHYLAGETLIEAYWKSVVMPGQGLFVGEPLARPFGAIRSRSLGEASVAQPRH